MVFLDDERDLCLVDEEETYVEAISRFNIQSGEAFIHSDEINGYLEETLALTMTSKLNGKTTDTISEKVPSTFEEAIPDGRAFVSKSDDEEATSNRDGGFLVHHERLISPFLLRSTTCFQPNHVWIKRRKGRSTLLPPTTELDPISSLR